MATQTQPKTIRFLSGKHPSFKMIRQPQGEKFLANNTVANDPSKPEIAYQFVGGVLELREGQDLLPDGLDPVTGDEVMQDAIEWIRQQPDFNSIVYEVQPEAPDPAPLYLAVGRLEAEGDLDGLVALGDEEYESWAREPVLEAIKGAVERVSAKQEPVKG